MLSLYCKLINLVSIYLVSIYLVSIYLVSIYLLSINLVSIYLLSINLVSIYLLSINLVSIYLVSIKCQSSINQNEKGFPGSWLTVSPAQLQYSSMMIVDCIEPSLDEVVILSYEGDMHEGGEGGPNSIYYDGAGTASLSNGCRYEGSFRKGMFHGKGVLSWSDGVKFEGSFESGRLNGKGAYEWHDGSTYVGSIRNGLRHGNGKFTGSSGQSYEGEWSSGKRSGQGKLWYNEEHSVMYTGEWMDNERHGYGTMKYASGSSYEGQWAYDKKCGSGVMVWKVNTTASDEVYTGEWKDDLPHGLGEHVWGEAAGRSMKKECCNIYRGSFQAGRRHGKGSFFYMNGSQYTGDWVADEKHGEGVFVYPDGRISVGRYEHNRSVPLKKVKKVKGDEEVEEGSAAAASAALVAPQFQLFVDDLYDLLPSQLLQLHSSSSSQQQQKQQQTGVMTESELKALEIKEMEHKARETKEMERLLLKYNQSLRAALNRYTDFSVRGRTRSDALLQTQQLQSFSPTNDAGRLYKACAVARSFHKRIFSMNLENALRFLRECGLVGTGGYLYSYDVCLILRRMRRAMTLVTMQKVLSFKRDVIHEEERQRRIEAEAKQAMQQQLAAMMALQQQQQQQEKLVGRRSQSMGLKSSSNSPRGGGGFTTTTTTAAGAVVSKSVSLDTSVPAISVSLDEEEEAAAQAQAQAQAAEKKEEEEEEAAAVAASRRRIEAVDEEEFDLLHTFRVNSIRDSYLHPESSPQQHHHQQQHHHHQHHQQPTALVFDFQPSQPLLDWEVVQLFVRTATEWYLRAKLHLNDDASPDMSLTQVLYYVLARKVGS